MTAFPVSSVSPVSSVLKALLCCLLLLTSAHAADIKLDIAHAGPRAVEEQTEKGILRDYAGAWNALSAALEQNNAAALGDLWVGFARDKFAQAIAAQKQSGLRVRYLARSHRLDAVFYSAEGSALELHDTAQLERQVLDGNEVVSSEEVTARYVVVMTPTSDHWQVRILQEQP